jgi:hypothetical protein
VKFTAVGTPAAAAALQRAAASAVLVARGFSQITAHPAPIAARQTEAWAATGVLTKTASTSPLPAISSTRVKGRTPGPKAAAAARARAASRLQTAARRARGAQARPGRRRRRARSFTPTRPTRVGGAPPVRARSVPGFTWGGREYRGRPATVAAEVEGPWRTS